MAEELDEENIFVWDGNYYAVEVTTRLGLEGSGGMVRAGPARLSPIIAPFLANRIRLQSEEPLSAEGDVGQLFA